MSYCFILAGTESRDYLLERCINCINKNKFYNNSDLFLYWQGDENKIPYRERFKGIIVSPTLMGVFYPRYALFARFGCLYDYTILIDDDLFMYEDTSYERAMSFLAFEDNNGVCNIGRHFDKRRNKFVLIDYKKDDYNVCGGIVFPKKCVNVIVDYFKDTDVNTTEDIFWILLYVKGYDLYRDLSSNVIHRCHNPAKDGSNSGYYKWRLEKPYKPLLPQYINAEIVDDYFGNGKRWKFPECRDVNEAGMAERRRCRKEMGLD